MTTDTEVYRLELRDENDVFSARQAGRDVAAAVGLDGQDLVRVATALSEVSRDVLAAGGGTAVFTVTARGTLTVVLTTFAATSPASWPEEASGLEAAARLADSATRHTDESGRAVITVEKSIGHPVLIGEISRRELERRIVARVPRAPVDELRTQNRELVAALEEVRARKSELERVNAQLEETKRSVVELYTELSEELERTNQGVVALYAEIDDKSRQLREASEAKTRFLRNVSHELRTPGNSVLGLARLLLDANAEPLSAEQRRQVQFILASAEDLTRLVNELLDLAKAESGRLEPNLDEVDLAALFSELRGTTAPLVTRPDVRLVVDDVAAVGTIRSDGTLLRHVLRNLLSNAVKFTEAGEVRMAAARSGPTVQLTVSDTGIGIPEEDQPHVFEEFYQVRSPLHSGVKGSGLGLPFARRVAMILGGELRLSSEPGVGTTFALELPVDGPPGSTPGRPEGADPAAVAPPVAEPPRPGIRKGP